MEGQQTMPADPVVPEAERKQRHIETVLQGFDFESVARTMAALGRKWRRNDKVLESPTAEELMAEAREMLGQIDLYPKPGQNARTTGVRVGDLKASLQGDELGEPSLRLDYFVSSATSGRHSISF